MRAMIIESDDNDVMYQIFERLNCGGLKLNPMQIRMCVFEGVFA